MEFVGEGEKAEIKHVFNGKDVELYLKESTI